MNQAIKSWAVDTGVKSVKTTAQTLGALLGASAFNVLHNVPWQDDIGIAVGAGVLCILHNVNSFPGGGDVFPQPPPAAPAEPAVVLATEQAPAAPAAA